MSEAYQLMDFLEFVGLFLLTAFLPVNFPTLTTQVYTLFLPHTFTLYIDVRECIFLVMQKIFAQFWSCISQVTYKQQVLMLRLKRTIASKSKCLHALLPITRV